MMKIKIKDTVLKGIIVFLCLTLLLFIATFFSEFSYYKYEVSEDTLLYNIRRQDYSDLVSEINRMDVPDQDDSETMVECYYIGKYFEAASIYKAYSGNDDAKAQIYSDKMNLYKTYVGDLAYVIDDIQTLLEL